MALAVKVYEIEDAQGQPVLNAEVTADTVREAIDAVNTLRAVGLMPKPVGPTAKVS